MKKLLLLYLFVLLSLLIGCDQHKEIVSSGDTVRIGLIAPLTGDEKQLSRDALQGIKTALKLQPYLENGDKVELVVEDNMNSVAATKKALEKLVDEDNVAAVLLFGISDIVLEIVPVADTYETPILALNATHPEITNNNAYISQLGFDDIFQGNVAALYVMDEMLIDRVAVVGNQQSAHYSFLADEFVRTYQTLGGTVVDYIKTLPEGDDFSAMLERLKKQQVKLLYLAVDPEQVFTIARSAKKNNWNPAMMGSDGLLSKVIVRHSDNLDLVEGMLATDFFSSVIPYTGYGKKVAKVFEKLFTEPGTTHTALGCEGTAILLQAMNRCEELVTKGCINYMLRSTEGFEGLFGKITIQPNGKSERPVFVNVIENSQMKPLVKVY